MKEVLTNLELYKDKNECGYEGYYLKAEYLIEEEYRTVKLTIPKIYLPINEENLVININHGCCYDSYIQPETTVDLGFGELHLDKVKDQDVTYYYKYEVIDERAEKMTLEEIEKKLGHKIELVSKK